MGRRCSGGMVVVAALLAVALGTQPATAAKRGQIGGPPTGGNPLSGPGDDSLSPAIVIGTGIRHGGRLEIFAVDSKQGLCVFVDRPRLGSSWGTCGEHSAPQGKILINSMNTDDRGRRGFSSLAGPIGSGVVRVRGVLKRPGRDKRVRGVVARPTGEILERLNQAEPFGYFATAFRGCPSFRRVRVEALDSERNVVSRARGGGTAKRGNRCPEGSGTTIIFRAGLAMAPASSSG